MKAIHNDVVLGLSVAILAALGCRTALGYSPDARAFPLLVLVPAVVLGLIIAVRGQLKLYRGGEAPPLFANARRFGLVTGLIVLVLVGVQYLGFLTTATVAIPVLSFVLGYRRLLPVIATTLAFDAVIYLIFVQVLSRPLPHEIWTRF